MAETTGISWTDSTLNFWIGCTKVGPGCDHCYAEVSTPSRAHKILWGAGQPRHRTAAATWKQAHTWQRQAISFFMEHGRKRRVFPNSLSDFFDNEVSVEWRREALEVIDATPDLIYLIVTKRIGNVKRMLEELGREELPVNVWLGITVVNQEEYDRDIQKLNDAPAGVRFLSIEPMLSAINLRWEWLWGTGGRNGIDWVIVGGESGPKARPAQVPWLRSIVQQCKEAGVPVHVKQLGEQPRGWCAARVHADPADDADCEDDYCDLYEAHESGQPCPGRCAFLAHKKGGDPAEWPSDLRVQEFPA